MKIIVAVVVYNRFDNIVEWIRCFKKCNTINSELIIIHNYNNEIEREKYKKYITNQGINYISRNNIGYDIGAFQDVCRERLNNFPNNWDYLLWCTDDVIPMNKDFIQHFVKSIIDSNGSVVCTEICDQVKRHIRTSGFILDKETSLNIQFSKDVVISKDDCHNFEHKTSNSFYEQILKMGKSVIQITPTINTGYLWDIHYREYLNRWDEHHKQFPINDNTVKRICIITVFDRYYKEGGKTLFNSIRRHTDCTGIDIKVITADEEVLNEFGKENCYFITEETKALYNNTQYSNEYLSKNYDSSWYRYEIFNMTDYDRVICIDSDCICVEDISYLFSDELDGYDLISVEDHIVSKLFNVSAMISQGRNLVNLSNRKKEGKIDIQPALLVINKSVINNEWYNKLVNYANTADFSYALDEGVLNDFIYINNLKIKLLPLEWNYQDVYERVLPQLPIPSKPIIIHCQESKPFKKLKTQVDERLHKWYDMWVEESKPINNSILDEIAIKHKSDKSSRFHNYAVKYDRILSPFKDSFLSVLEIGVAQGQSIKMWTDYFTKAIIHGADIAPASKVCESYSDRVKFHLIDQRSEAQLKSLEQFSPFDLIVDDGDHFWMEQILTFNTLFPYVRSGGIYIVEDTTTSYWEYYNNNPITAIEYFKTLVDEIHLKGARGSVPLNPPQEFGDWDKGWHRREDCHISIPSFESIQFMNGFIVIYKR